MKAPVDLSHHDESLATGRASAPCALLPEVSTLVREAPSVPAKTPAPDRKTALMYSIIVPCYNEADNILPCLKRIPDLPAPFELIVVDDGSTDGTARAVESLGVAWPHLRLLRLERNRGKAAAVHAGFRAARGELLMILDADMSVAPEALSHFLPHASKGRARLVNGSRLVLPCERGAMSWVSRLGNKAFCVIFRLITGRKLTDTLCGTKVIRKKDYLRLRTGLCQWGDYDLLFGAVENDLEIVEVPVRYRRRRGGRSKMRPIVHGLRFLRTFARARKRLMALRTNAARGSSCSSPSSPSSA